MKAAISVAVAQRRRAVRFDGRAAKRVSCLLAGLLCLGLLPGCGQKGPLSLPAPAPAASGVGR